MCHSSKVVELLCTPSTNPHTLEVWSTKSFRSFKETSDGGDVSVDLKRYTLRKDLVCQVEEFVHAITGLEDLSLCRSERESAR
jgi:hypothetical protein